MKGLPRLGLVLVVVDSRIPYRFVCAANNELEIGAGWYRVAIAVVAQKKKL